MKDAKTQIITAVIAALATILAAWIGKCNFGTPPEKESSQPFENTAQVIPNQQNQAEKVENNQKKEITVQGDYVEGDKLETRPKETRQTKPVSQKQAIDSSKNEASRKYENSGLGTQINIEEMKAPLTINTSEKPYRTLTSEIQNQLITSIEELIKKHNLPEKCCLKVTYQSEDKEARNFAEIIKTFLKQKSYNMVGEGVFSNHYPPYYGYKVYFAYGAIYVQVHSYD